MLDKDHGPAGTHVVTRRKALPAGGPGALASSTSTSPAGNKSICNATGSQPKAMSMQGKANLAQGRAGLCKCLDQKAQSTEDPPHHC